MARRNTKTPKPSTQKTTVKTAAKPSKPTTQKTKPPTATAKDRRPTNAERSALYGRREAAKVLKTVLKGDANRRAIASIKTLVYSPSVRNKKGTFALVCQTLKYLPVIKDVLEISAVLNSKWKRQQELIYITTYDLLFGKEFSSFGTAEKYLFQRKAALDSALEKVLVKKKEKRVEDLLSQYETPALYLTNLKLDVDSAFNELAKLCTVKKDDLVPDLLLLPPGVDLHDHPLVKNGSVFLQGKGSSMVAVALGPQPGWQVLDACSAPGNKTVHLAALMKGKGKILACELNADRVKLLQNTIKVAGAKNVEVHHGDFLKLDPEDPTYSKLRAILLDPSCSGSGTAVERLDHLLPSNMNNKAGASDIIRLTKLAGFQKKALEHALSSFSVELSNGGQENDANGDSADLGQTRLGRIVIAGGRQFLGKLNSARKNFPSKVFLLLLGFYTANALATILGQTGDWDVLVAGIVVAAIEGIGMLMYRRNMLSSGRLQPLVVLVNYWKAGVCLGLFVDAFKLGS